MTRHLPARTCRDCGRNRPNHGRGLCRGCWLRQWRATNGRYDVATGTGMGGPGIPKTAADIAARLEDYAFLRALNVRRLDIAARLGVSYRTLNRYDARLRQQQDTA
ncbi:hypothetical protein ACIBI3_02235 [Actinomadura luteofluorescens]|uniref:hypothetical protein n=1 Tax=Actinomadura luteofluorescens TaxID=46163 RepID=UPI003477DECF